MLKNIDPLAGPDLLHLLASMGHGDELVIADANFPAAAVARRLVRLDGVAAVSALQVILSLIPLDQYVDSPAVVMAVVGGPGELGVVPDTYDDFQRVLNAAEGARVNLTEMERFAFYARARDAFGVVVTGERRLYGNIIVKKGVIAPPAS